MKADKFKMAACAQCLEYKPISNFRKYYNGNGNYYKRCKACERINKRYKYLHSKIHANIHTNNQAIEAKELEEMTKMQTLYSVLTTKGAEIPSLPGIENTNRSTESTLDSMLKAHNVSVPTAKKQPAFTLHDVDNNAVDNVVEEHLDDKSTEVEDNRPPEVPLHEIDLMLRRDFAGADPDDLYDEYDILKEKYRPQIGVDALDNYNPVFNDTYKHELETLLNKIMDYEDSLN